jgi:sporulation protein YlmC with PRC-barrel domain
MATMTQDRTNTINRNLSAGTLIGDTVRNRQGEDLGRLKEIMLDVERGRIAYGVLESGAFLGMGGKLFAIPFEAFTVDRKNHKLVLDVPKETIQNAEGFDPNNWPDTADEQWSRRTHQHYGFSPYWERRS